MEISNVWFWVLVLINILGFFIYRFASIANGTKKEIDKTIGLCGLLFSYLIMLFRFGWISLLFLLLVVPLLVVPFLIIIINHLEDKLFPERIKLRKLHGLTREQYGNIGEDAQEKIDNFRKKYEK